MELVFQNSKKRQIRDRKRKQTQTKRKVFITRLKKTPSIKRRSNFHKLKLKLTKNQGSNLIGRPKHTPRKYKFRQMKQRKLILRQISCRILHTNMPNKEHLRTRRILVRIRKIPK